MTPGSPRILRAAVASIILATLLGACGTPREADPSDLLDAVRTGDQEAALRALDGGADPNAKDGEGRTALMYASRNGLIAVRLLIRKAADLNAQADDGRTALMEAALTCNKALVESLLENGARKDLKDGTGRKASDYVPLESTQPECAAVRQLVRGPPT